MRLVAVADFALRRRDRALARIRVAHLHRVAAAQRRETARRCFKKLHKIDMYLCANSRFAKNNSLIKIFTKTKVSWLWLLTELLYNFSFLRLHYTWEDRAWDTNKGQSAVVWIPDRPGPLRLWTRFVYLNTFQLLNYCRMFLKLLDQKTWRLNYGHAHGPKFLIWNSAWPSS